MERTGSFHQSFALSPEDVLLSIKSDPFQSPFCKEDFDKVAFAGGIISASSGGFSSSLLSTGRDDSPVDHELDASGLSVAVLSEKNIDSACHTLEVSAHWLDVAIRKHILSNEDTLLGSIKGVNGMSGRCENLKRRVWDIRRNINKLKRIPGEPLSTAHAHLKEIKRLKEARHCLKQLQRMLSALQRIKQQEGGVILDDGESCKVTTIVGLDSAAQSLMIRGVLFTLSIVLCHQELEEVIADPSMASITLVEEERHHIHIIGSSIRRFAAEALAKGLNELSQSQVASALEVFHNLACLPEQIKSCVSRLINNIGTQVSEVLRLRRKLSKAIMEALQEGYKQAELLHMVLLEQTDTISHECYIDIVSNDKHFREASLPDTFWLGLSSMLQKSIENALDVEQQESLNSSASVVSGPLAVDSGRSSLSRTTTSPYCSSLPSVYPHLYKALCSMISQITETVTKLIGQTAAVKIEAEKYVDPFRWSQMLDGFGILGGVGTVDLASQSFASTEVQGEKNISMDATDKPVPPMYWSSSARSAVQYHSSLASKDDLRNSLSMVGILHLNTALDPLKDHYFAASYERLTTPVECMFAHSEGYMSAVPSKHDLKSFLKAITEEFSIVEGNPFIVQLVLRGVTSALSLFLTKAGELVSTEPSAFRVSQQLNQIRPWAPSSEHRHNHLVLVLLGRLRDGLSELLMTLANSFNALPHAGTEALSMCNDSMAAAIGDLDILAKQQILSPLLIGISAVAEDAVANLHNDNFGRGTQEADTGSMLTIEDCISGLWLEYLKPIQDIGAPFAVDALRAFAERLIRPLKDAGKRKLAHYLARFEASLSQITKVNSLGDAFSELRSFRQLIFLKSPELLNRSPSFLEERCLYSIRPSSVLHYLCSLCPDKLSSPHVKRHDTRAGMVSWLLNGGASEEWKCGHRKSSKSTCHDSSTRNEWPGLTPDISYEAESQAWANLRRAIDSYQQRQSVSRKDVSGSNHPHEEQYPSVSLLLMAGPQLLSSYAARLDIEKNKNKKNQK